MKTLGNTVKKHMQNPVKKHMQKPLIEDNTV